MIFLGGIEEAANDVADFFKDDFAGGIVDAAENVGDWFADDFADFWTDDVGGALEDFGNAIGGIFGKSMLYTVKAKLMADSASTHMSYM